MKVTIVITTYNDGNYLERALKSCLNQGADIVIIDDGSSQNTMYLEYIENAKYPNVRIVRNKYNMGLAASRNTAIRNHVETEWVICLDADDLMAPGAIDYLLLSADVETAVIYGNILCADMLAKPVVKPLTPELIKQGNPIFQSSMFRKSAWEKVNGYQVRNGNQYEDWDFWGRLCKIGEQFKYVDKLIYTHTEREDSMLRRMAPRGEEYSKLAVSHFSEPPGILEIGLIVKATNKYTKFFPQLLESVRSYFFPVGSSYKDRPIKIKIYVMTNKPEDIEDSPQIIKLKVTHEDWPMPTLKRYHDMCNHVGSLMNSDYLFYCDVDMRFVAKVGKEMLGDALTAIQHPGFYDKDRETYSYCEDPKSRAYIASDEGNMYYCGGFQGGTKEAYLAAVTIMRDNIQIDIDKGIIATWHDESHWNRYLIDNPPGTVLSPSYCYPESWGSTHLSKKIIALVKDHKEYQK